MAVKNKGIVVAGSSKHRERSGGERGERVLWKYTTSRALRRTHTRKHTLFDLELKCYVVLNLALPDFHVVFTSDVCRSSSLAACSYFNLI